MYSSLVASDAVSIYEAITLLACHDLPSPLYKITKKYGYLQVNHQLIACFNCWYLRFIRFSLHPFSIQKSAIYFPMQNIFLTPIHNLASDWNIVYYKVLPKDKSSFGGTDWGLHFCKETNIICKNALFLDFLAYLHFVAW